MPAKTKKPAGSKKGKGLTKKVGPLPVYAYLIVGVIILGYIYYRSRQSSNSGIAGSLDQQTIPSGIVVPSSNQGATSGGGDSGGTISSPNTFPTDYATQTDLANAIDSVNNQTAQDIASITFPNPVINPNINITVPHSAVAATTTKSKTAAKQAAHAAAPKRITYYTYKKNVPLKAGQTLHFTKGKGYYAA